MSSKKLRNKVPASVKKEARKLFESGMAMYDIHKHLEINLGTLYNISSKEGWIKGSLNELVYIKEMELVAEELGERKLERLKAYRKLTQGITDQVEFLQGVKANNAPKLVKAHNEALSLQATALQKTYQIEKELYGILSPLEEVDLDLKRIEHEKLKKALDKDNDDSDIVV